MARTLSVTGHQLFGIDQFRNTGKPLLELLGDPESIFLKGLARFERRTLYANIAKDRNAVFYTTWISKTDPFVPLEKRILTYLKGYEEVILDLSAPLIPRKPDTTDSPLRSFFNKGFNTLCSYFPTPLHLLMTIPLSTGAFLILSGYWSLRSRRRIRLYEHSLASIQPGDYPFHHLIEGAPAAATNVNHGLHSPQDTEYVSPECSGDTATSRPASGRGGPSCPAGAQGSGPAHEEPRRSHPSKHACSVLALAPYQFRIIDTLDGLEWHKHAVHIQQPVNSHAAIIVRIQRPRYSEGYDVFRHWLEEEFIV